MCRHTVLFKLWVLIIRLWSFCSERGGNVLHLPAQLCRLDLSAASEEDSMSHLPSENLIILKGHSGTQHGIKGSWD